MISTEEFIKTEVPYLASEKISSVEMQVLQLTAEDNTTEQIGKAVFRSPRTVEVIRLKLKERLGVQTLAGLVARGFELGLIEMPKDIHQHILWQVPA